MDYMLHDRKLLKTETPNYKRTTDQQYSLLKSKLANTLQTNNDCHKNNSNGILKKNNIYWMELTEKLNNIGPPYRTMQQWKKVWCDFKRGERKRKFKSTTKVVQYVKEEPNYESEISETEIHERVPETDALSTLETRIIKAETKDYEQNSQTMYTTYSNEYDNDYSYPDDESLQETCADKKKTLIPDDSSCNAYSNLSKLSNGHLRSPPPLQPSNSLMLDQTMYTLQNQMEHQEKLLEHLHQMSTTIASLMERQVVAVEKQTVAIHRQTLATERQTSVMNNFNEKIRDKMFKGTASTENSIDDIL